MYQKNEMKNFQCNKKWYWGVKMSMLFKYTGIHMYNGLHILT